MEKTTLRKLNKLNKIFVNEEYFRSIKDIPVGLYAELKKLITERRPRLTKPACVNCKFFSEYDASDMNEHTYHIKYCNKHSYGMSMWNCNEVACTKFESKSA